MIAHRTQVKTKLKGSHECNINERGGWLESLYGILMTVNWWMKYSVFQYVQRSISDNLQTLLPSNSSSKGGLGLCQTNQPTLQFPFILAQI
jgi:hypothetical protein